MAKNPKTFLQECNDDLGSKNDLTSFMKSGKSGTWKKHFTPELEEKFDKWEDTWLKNSDFKFQYSV